MHPTVKPVALVADAIKDCSRRGEIVLDPFAGSARPLIAAEKTGRRARADRVRPGLLRPDRAALRAASPASRPALPPPARRFEDIAEERRADTLHIKKEKVQ